jgi:hypothetical protein
VIRTAAVLTYPPQLPAGAGGDRNRSERFSIITTTMWSIFSRLAVAASSTTTPPVALSYPSVAPMRKMSPRACWKLGCLRFQNRAVRGVTPTIDTNELRHGHARVDTGSVLCQMRDTSDILVELCKQEVQVPAAVLQRSPIAHLASVWTNHDPLEVRPGPRPATGLDAHPGWAPTPGRPGETGHVRAQYCGPADVTGGYWPGAQWQVRSGAPGR